MSSLFRLRYHLRRPGEKRPLLLLEPIFISRRAFGEYFESKTVESLSEKHKQNAAITTLKWYLYAEGGICKTVEISKLQTIYKLQELLHEIRTQGFSNKQPTELAQELKNLWQCNIKGIATNQLAKLPRGSIIAPEGVWLVDERSFYSLLPCPKEIWHKLRDSSAEQHVQLKERSTGCSYHGWLAIVEQFSSTDEKLLLCRLSLEKHSLISLKQTVWGEQNYLYSLSFTKETMPSDMEIFLFSPVNIISSGFALRKFLHSRLENWKGLEQNLEYFEDMAADFIGWGEYKPALDKDWLPLNTGINSGGWRIQKHLFQKHGGYILQRARNFGGYPIEKLLAELDGSLPLSLLKSLFDYLCGHPNKNKIEEVQQTKDNLWGSCKKIESYLLAKEMLFNPDLTKDANNPQSAPRQISPQGRKMLQKLIIAGKKGLVCYHLKQEQPEVLSALLRSGWAVQNQSHCYAANFLEKAPQQQAQTTEDLLLLLNHYKKKNELRGAPSISAAYGNSKNMERACYRRPTEDRLENRHENKLPNRSYISGQNYRAKHNDQKEFHRGKAYQKERNSNYDSYQNGYQTETPKKNRIAWQEHPNYNSRGKQGSQGDRQRFANSYHDSYQRDWPKRNRNWHENHSGERRNADNSGYRGKQNQWNDNPNGYHRERYSKNKATSSARNKHHSKITQMTKKPRPNQ